MLESLCFFIVTLKENVFQDIGNHLTFNCWRDWIRKSKDIAQIIFTEHCDKCLKEGTVVFSQKDMIPWKMSAIEKRKLMQDQQSCTEQNQSLFDMTTKILVSETVQVTSFFDGNISCCNFSFNLTWGTNDDSKLNIFIKEFKNILKVKHF